MHYFAPITFLKLITLTLVCAQTDLFAPKGGGGVCSSSGDSYSGRGDCYSGFGSGHCAEPCIGGYSAGDREANSHGGSSSSGGGSGSAYDGSVAAPAISSAAAVETASRQLLDQCYVVYSNRQAVKTCSKQEVLTAVKSVSTLYAGVAAGELTDKAAHQMLMGLISLGLPLDCATARQAPAELCSEVDHFSQMRQTMQDFAAQRTAAAQTGSAPFIFSLNEARAMVDEITQERLAGVSQTYNEVIKGTKTPAQAKQALDAAVAQGMPLAAMGDLVVASAEKVKREIEHEVTEYKQLLLRPKRFNAAQLAAASNCNGGMYNLPSAEIADLTRQFGGERWLIRAFELTTRKCAAPQKMHHLCYSHIVGGGVIAGHPGVAAFDAMTDAQVAARFNEADRQIAVARAQGL